VVTVDSGLETLMQGIKRFPVPGTPVPEPSPAPPAIAQADTVPPGHGALYGVHVDSFATAEEVAVAKDRYLALNHPITVQSVDLGENGIWQRVVVGRFTDKTEAQQLVRRLDETLHPPFTTVVRLDR
jgi:cell division septation protein DedD